MSIIRRALAGITIFLIIISWMLPGLIGYIALLELSWPLNIILGLVFFIIMWITLSGILDNNSKIIELYIRIRGG